MFKFLKKLFGGDDEPQQPTDEEFEADYDLKLAGLERVLGKMHEMVGHAVIPFQVGGAVDMYYFPHDCEGTAFVTMELLNPDGSGPQPSSIGTYELLTFTKHDINDESVKEPFSAIERRMCGLMTTIGFYSFEAVLNPGETCEVPAGEGEPNRCVVFDEYRKPGVDFRVGDREHGLLICMELFRSEMEYAMSEGSPKLLELLKSKGHYPNSDLDREPVV